MQNTTSKQTANTVKEYDPYDGPITRRMADEPSNETANTEVSRTLLQERDHFSRMLSRYGRHDQNCKAFGSYNCDPECSCGFAAACGMGIVQESDLYHTNYLPE